MLFEVTIRSYNIYFNNNKSIFFQGDSNRVISGHSLNLHSSRSHCIFTIYVEARSRTDSRYSLSKFNLVDLAGSERVGKTHVGVSNCSCFQSVK